MKLTVSLDLTPHKAAAITAIDDYYNRAALRVSGVPMIHALKLAKAQDAIAGKTPDPQLVAEAAARNVDVHTLCVMIFQKSVDADTAIMALETQRQAAKTIINAATSQQAIDSIIKAHRPAQV